MREEVEGRAGRKGGRGNTNRAGDGTNRNDFKFAIIIVACSSCCSCRCVTAVGGGEREREEATDFMRKMTLKAAKNQKEGKLNG